MNNFNFSTYCNSLLNHPIKSKNVFYVDNNQNYTYHDLITASFQTALFYKNSPHTFFALSLSSPFVLFSCIIGAIFSQKKILILSSQMPPLGKEEIQKRIPFEFIIDETCLLINNLSHPQNILKDMPSIDFEFPFLSILSSGSTGPAKEVPLTLANIYHSAVDTISFFKMNSSHTSFLNLSLHHIGGLMVLWRAFFSGGKITSQKEKNYDFISLVPLQLSLLLKNNDDLKKLQKCKAVLIGGSFLNESLKNEALLKEVHLCETYGMSETCSIVLLNGRVLNDQVVKLDEAGHFLIKSKTLSPSLPLDEDGFYHTRDIGEKKEDGMFSFLHREDLVFKSGGEFINPLIIENKVKELPWITEAILVPVEDSKWTKGATLIYFSNDKSKESSDIQKFLKNFFPPYLVPRYFIKNPKGYFEENVKPKRFDLLKLAQEDYFKKKFFYSYIQNDQSPSLFVFLHGFMEDSTDMLPLMEKEKGSYLFIDLPGHGKSTSFPFETRSFLFLDLINLIKFYQKDKSLILYGYSMGGRISLELLLMGLKIDTLILESAHFGLNSNSEKQMRFKSDLFLFKKENFNLEHFLKNWYLAPIFADYNQSPNYHSDLKKKLKHDYNLWQESLSYFSSGLFPYERPHVLNALKKQNILGIYGSKDSKYKIHFNEIKKDLPHLQLFEVINSGHNPHKTQTNRIKELLEKTNLY